MFACICLNIPTHLFRYTHSHIHSNTHIHMHMPEHTHFHINVWGHTHTHICARTHAHINILIKILHTHKRIHKHTNTYSHTQCCCHIPLPSALQTPYSLLSWELCALFPLPGTLFPPSTCHLAELHALFMSGFKGPFLRTPPLVPWLPWGLWPLLCFFLVFPVVTLTVLYSGDLCQERRTHVYSAPGGGPEPRQYTWEVCKKIVIPWMNSLRKLRLWWLTDMQLM